jgi:hypothetical protein
LPQIVEPCVKLLEQVEPDFADGRERRNDVPQVLDGAPLQIVTLAERISSWPDR